MIINQLIEPLIDFRKPVALVVVVWLSLLYSSNHDAAMEKPRIVTHKFTTSVSKASDLFMSSMLCDNRIQ